MSTNMIDLDHLIEDANGLAPLPASTVRLAQVVTQPGSHLDEVTELIAFDQALTINLLRAANSATSGSNARIGTVQDAVMRLGMAQTLAFAVAGSAKPLLKSRVPEYGLDEGALWRHSVAAAVAAEVASSVCKVEIPRETFTAALLHDVGKLVMARYLEPEILEFIKRAQEVDHLGQLEAESMLLSVNHGELGGLIAQHWQLPAGVVKGIVYHHDPEKGGETICHLTCVANEMAHALEASLGGKEYGLRIPPSTIERLGLTSKSIAQYKTSVIARYEQVSGRYNSI